MFERALRAMRDRGVTAPSVAIWVPGRLEVFGTHTDYAGGHSLVAALPRGFVFLAAPRTDRVVEVVDALRGERAVIGGGQVTPVSWQEYAEVAVSRLDRNFPASRGGATIAFASDLPSAAGMSSSSALMVGIASALIRLRNLGARAEWTQNITSHADLAVYLACVENGSAFRGLAGDAGVGTHGGSEDHAAMLLARPMMLSAYSFVPLRHVADAPMPADWRFVIASSGVVAEKTGAARDAYNRLSRGAAILLGLWNENNTPAASLAEAITSSDRARQRLEELIRRSAIPAWPQDALERRLRHFCAETQIVLDASRAFDRGDKATLSDLSERSQTNAERLLGNQVPETVSLVREARECGAFAARSFGAGFGGSVWALIDADSGSTFSREWLDRYQRAHPGRRSESFVAVPGPPRALSVFE
jgi:galactokinase